eukprot:5319726-Ditylum_brightwellii.AAC.1
MTEITGEAVSFDKRFDELGDPVPSEANEYINNTKKTSQRKGVNMSWHRRASDNKMLLIVSQD